MFYELPEDDQQLGPEHVGAVINEQITLCNELESNFVFLNHVCCRSLAIAHLLKLLEQFVAAEVIGCPVSVGKELMSDEQLGVLRTNRLQVYFLTKGTGFA
jgi:hypothetical protein